MNQIKFIEELLAYLEATHPVLDDTIKAYTAKEVNEKVIAHIKRVQKLVEEKTQYNIIVDSINGKMVQSIPTPSKALEVEGFYIVQPLAQMTAQEMQEMMDVINRAANDGEFGGKTVLILPHDVKVMRAQIETIPVDDDDKWEI